MNYSKHAGLIVAATLTAFSVSGFAMAQAGGGPNASQPPQKATGQDASAQGPSVDHTKVGVLLDTPALREVFEKHFPEAVANPKLAQGRGMTLRQMQAFAPKEFTDDRLAAMDADLKTLVVG
ncbi:MAG: hypothetical protein ABIO39_14980 [Caulobacteraceae bacterium]